MKEKERTDERERACVLFCMDEAREGWHVLRIGIRKRGQFPKTLNDDSSSSRGSRECRCERAVLSAEKGKKREKKKKDISLREQRENVRRVCESEARRD